MSVSSIAVPAFRFYRWGTFPYNVSTGALAYNPLTVPSYTIKSPNPAYNFTFTSPLNDTGTTTAPTAYYSLNAQGRTVVTYQPTAASSVVYSFRVNSGKLVNPYSNQALFSAYTPVGFSYNPTSERYQSYYATLETNPSNWQTYLDNNTTFYLPYLRLSVTQKGDGYTVVQQPDGTYTLSETVTDGFESVQVSQAPQEILNRFFDTSTTIAPDILSLVEAASFPLYVPNFGNAEADTATDVATDTTTATTSQTVDSSKTAADTTTTEASVDTSATTTPIIQSPNTQPATNAIPQQPVGTTGQQQPLLGGGFQLLQNTAGFLGATPNATQAEGGTPLLTVSPSTTTDYFNTKPFSGPLNGFSTAFRSPATEALRLQDFRRPFAFALPRAEALPLSQEEAFAGKPMDFTQTEAGFGNLANLGEHQELNRQRATGEPLIARQFRIRRLRQTMQALK
jgi:hypothetical protein